MNKWPLLIIMLVTMFSCSQMSTMIDGKPTEEKIRKWAAGKNDAKLVQILSKADVDESLKDKAAYYLGLTGDRNPEVVTKLLVPYALAMKNKSDQKRLIQTFVICKDAKTEGFMNNYLAAYIDHPKAGGMFLEVLMAVIADTDLKRNDNEQGALQYLSKGDGLYNDKKLKLALVQYLHGTHLSVRKGEAMEKSARVLMELGYYELALAYLNGAVQADTKIIRDIRKNPLYTPLKAMPDYSLIIPPHDYLLLSKQYVSKEKLNAAPWFKSFSESQPVGISNDGEYGVFTKNPDNFIVPLKQGEIIVKNMLNTNGSQFKVDVNGNTKEFQKVQKKDMSLKIAYPDAVYDKEKDMWLYSTVQISYKGTIVSSIPVKGSFLIKQAEVAYSPSVTASGSHFIVFVPVAFSNEGNIGAVILVFKKID